MLTPIMYVDTCLQVLDSDFTPENKQLCAETSRPLIDAVEKLTTYGSSPEFASIPARISKEVCLSVSLTESSYMVIYAHIR